MLLMERPRAAIGDKRDPDVFEATACRESGGKCRRERVILLTNTNLNALKDVKSKHMYTLWPKNSPSLWEVLAARLEAPTVWREGAV